MLMNKVILGFLIIGIAIIGGTLYYFTRPTKIQIRIAGSTTCLPIIQEAAIQFMSEHPEVSINVEGGGSGHGYASLIDRAIDIAMASRPPKQVEVDQATQNGVELRLHKIAMDAVVIIVNPKVADDYLNLTLEQVAKIFAGNYTKWKEVDSSLPNEDIIVFTREAGSGTRGTFEEHVMETFGLEITADAHEVPSNPQMAISIKNTDYSIGYVGLGFYNEHDHGIVYLAVNDTSPYIPPTKENIYSLEYPIARYLYLVTNGEPEEGSWISRFIAFVLSSEGQQIVEEKGFLSLPSEND